MPARKNAPDVEDRNPDAQPSGKRLHKATYATDKRKGGYLIRVAGPDAEKFLGREVPVTTRSGDEHAEKLIRVLWTGKDQETGENVALYTFESKPRDLDDEIPF